jgi:hypothetical protein
MRCTGERRCAYRVLVGKHEGKRQFGRPIHRLEDNIYMNLQEVGWRGGGGGWIELIWLKTGEMVGSCECSNDPLGSINCGEFD